MGKPRFASLADVAPKALPHKPHPYIRILDIENAYFPMFNGIKINLFFQTNVHILLVYFLIALFFLYENNNMTYMLFHLLVLNTFLDIVQQNMAISLYIYDHMIVLTIFLQIKLYKMAIFNDQTHIRYNLKFIPYTLYTQKSLCRMGS